MLPKPSLPEARLSLTEHVAAKGAELRAKYGPAIGWSELQRLLADRECVRYPCELVFDAEPLHPGECAYPQPKGDRPEDGFRLCVHPYFSLDPARVPLLALYQLVVVNYGEFASPDDAETFGAAALGMSREVYYEALCALAAEISTEPDSEAEPDPAGCSCGSAGGCHPEAPAEPGTANSCAQLAKECADA